MIPYAIACAVREVEDLNQQLNDESAIIKPMGKTSSFTPAKMGLFATMFVFSLTACSPGMFFGNGEDKGVKNTTNYKKVNAACANLNLSSSSVDVPMVRSLLECLNFNGALEKTVALVRALKDEELEPIVAVANEYLLTDQKALYAFEHNFREFESRGTLKKTLASFGTLLEKPKLISAGIGALANGYADSPKNFTKAIEHMATKVSSASLGDILDFGLTVSSSKAFESLLVNIATESDAAASCGNADSSARKLTNELLAYLKDARHTDHVDAVRSIIDFLISGELSEALGKLAHFDPASPASETFKNQVKQIAVGFEGITRKSSESGRPILDGLSSLFHYLHRPIFCLQESQSVPDGVMHVIRELSIRDTSDAASFILRENTLVLTGINSLCDFPPQLRTHYGSLVELAESTGLGPSVDLMKAFHTTGTNGKLIDFFVSAVGDTGDTDQSGIKHLIPVLSHLTSKNAWRDLFLLSSAPRPEDWDMILGVLSLITSPVPGIEDTSARNSIYDIFSDAIAKADEKIFCELITSLPPQKSDDRNYAVRLKSAFENIREAFYTNDAYPFVDLIHNVLANASKHEKLTNVLFKLATSPDLVSKFEETLGETHEMANDGRLRDILDAVFILFHKFAQSGATEIREMTAPSFVPRRRHDLARADLDDDGFLILSSIWKKDELEKYSACTKLDVGLRMDDYAAPGYEDQLTNFVSCLNVEGNYKDVDETVNFLRNTATEDGRSYFQFNMDLLKAIGLEPAEMRCLSNIWLRAFDDGRFTRLTDAAPFWINKNVTGEADTAETHGPVLKPLFDLAKPIIEKARLNLRSLNDFAAKVLKKDGLPIVIGYLEALADKPDVPPTDWVPPSDPQTDEGLGKWLDNKECMALSRNRAERELQKRLRIAEIWDEYQNAASTWEVVDGKLRRSWTKEAFRKNLEPVFEKFVDPNQSIEGRRVMDAFGKVMGYFSLKPGQPKNQHQHLSAEELLNWFHEKSFDYRPITYFYPGERWPRVRLVNTLDRLDIALVNSDFVGPWPVNKNFGMQFLAEIGEAWGDEEFQYWPEEIQKKYPDKKAPKLKDAVAHIEEISSMFENLVGFPELPGCPKIHPDIPDEPETATSGPPNWLPTPGTDLSIRDIQERLYNIRQVVEVLKENLPREDSLGMGTKMLRNLFFEHYYTTPKKYRDPKVGDKNNLSVILKFTRLDTFHQMSRNLRRFQLGDPSLTHFFESFVEGSVSPDMTGILNVLFINDQRKFLWNALDTIFDAIDGRGGETGDLLYLRKFVLYALANSGEMGISDLTVKNVRPILEHHIDFFNSHSDYVGKILRNKDLPGLLKTLYDENDPENATGKSELRSIMVDALSEPYTLGVDSVFVLRALEMPDGVTNPWDVFIGRVHKLDEIPEYRALNLWEIGRQVFDFFKEDGSNDDARAAARRLRHYVAERLESRPNGQASDAELLLVLAQKNPDEFYNILRSFSNHVENKNLNYFLSLIRRSLSGP